MPRFEPPEWASPPQCSISLQVNGSTIRIDEKPYYVLGRDKDSTDIHLDSEAVSRHHAAIVHHTTGKVYLIDLRSTHGTFMNEAKLEDHKPTKLLDGTVLQFGGLDAKYIVKLSEGSAKAAPVRYRASHLLVKHRAVRNPKSWKEAQVTRSEEEALQMIQAFHKQLSAGDPASLEGRFAELAQVESHCSSAKRGGDLGEFKPGNMMKAFEDATAALQVGELSGPVFTDSGVHLILRTE